MTAPRETGPPRAGLAADYLAHLRRIGTPLASLTAAARASETLAVAYRDRFLPAPVFLAADERRRIARDLSTVYRLLRELPKRRFGGDTAAMARAVGMNRHQVDLAVRAAADETRPLVQLARADIYREADSFALLELNITSALGGFENADINRAMLAAAPLRRFTTERGLAYADTLAVIVAALRAECAPFLPGGGRTPVVALADWPESYKTYRPRLELLSRLLRRFGIDGVPCHVGEIDAAGPAVTARGRRVDAVWRFFLLEEVATADDFALIDPLAAAAEHGRTAVFSRFDAELYGNKGALAMLADPACRAELTGPERACLDRFLPATVPLTEADADWRGERIAPVPFALAHREDLILKPTLLHGGNGIVPGWQAGGDAWAAALADAADGPYVLQRRVRPAPDWFPGEDGEPEAFYLNWGAFTADPALTGPDGWAGCIVRGSGDSDVGVVSMGSGARVGCCFHETDEAAPA
ncbi:MAG TPA: hypothetical protein VFU12_10465 [Glycomyces sp.]|nr:hypothetical protein [Glycomyces sp.]